MHCRAPLALVTSLACGLLAACGGGGSSDPQTGLMTFNAAQAYRNVLTTPGAWTLPGTGNGRTVELQFATVQLPATQFPVTGEATALTTFRSKVIENAVQTGSNELRYYFNNANTALVGVDHPSVAQPFCDRPVLPLGTIPVNAQAGASGSIATLVELDGCLSSSSSVRTYALGWSLEADSIAAGGSLTLFCLNATRRDSNGAISGAESDCFETAANGSLGARARVTLVSALATTPPSTLTVVAKNY